MEAGKAGGVVGPGGTATSEGVLANFFNSLLSKKTGQPGSMPPGVGGGGSPGGGPGGSPGSLGSQQIKSPGGEDCKFTICNKILFNLQLVKMSPLLLQSKPASARKRLRSLTGWPDPPPVSQHPLLLDKLHPQLRQTTTITTPRTTASTQRQIVEIKKYIELKILQKKRKLWLPSVGGEKPTLQQQQHAVWDNVKIGASWLRKIWKKATIWAGILEKYFDRGITAGSFVCLSVCLSLSEYTLAQKWHLR